MYVSEAIDRVMNEFQIALVRVFVMLNLNSCYFALKEKRDI